MVPNGGLVSRPEFETMRVDDDGLVAIVKMASKFFQLHELEAFSHQDVENLEIHDIRRGQGGDQVDGHLHLGFVTVSHGTDHEGLK